VLRFGSDGGKHPGSIRQEVKKRQSRGKARAKPRRGDLKLEAGKKLLQRIAANNPIEDGIRAFSLRVSFARFSLRSRAPGDGG